MSLRVKLFRIIAVILLLLQMTLIFCLSAQKAEESRGLSKGFTYKILSVIYPDFNEMTEEEQIEVIRNLPFSVRKLAHFGLYALLGFYAFLSLVTYKKIPFVLRCFLALLISMLYAASDEYHQTFVNGRSGEIRDVLIDSSGALIAIIFAVIIILLSKKLRKSLVFCEAINSGGNNLRKKELLFQNESLFERLNKAHAENNSLKKQIGELQKEIEDLKQKLKEATEPEIENQEDTPLKHLEEKVLKKELSADFDYASKVIGEIVVSSASYSNQLTVDGNSEYKELVNLILGKCEIAKGEILAAISSDCDNATKIQLIDSIKRETEEYFLSVMAQRN